MAREGSPRPLLILHIPKTAGTTLGWIATRQYAPDDLYSVYPPDYGAKLDGLILACRKAAPAAAIGHFHFGLHAQIPAGAAYVTFLRDPVDQVVSMYNHLAGSDDPTHRAILSPGAGLETLIAHDWGRNLQTQYLTGLSRAEIEADPGRAVRRAVVNLEDHFVGVGVVERFAESVQLMARELGWRVPLFPSLNRATDRPVRLLRRDVPGEMLERVRRANLCDERVYAYVRAVVDARLSARPGVRLRGRAVAAASRLVTR